MVPLSLFRSREVSVAVAAGFAFVVGYYGVPFLMSLYLQQERGLSPLAAGAAFVPMMATGVALTPLSPRLAERIGAQRVITVGLVLMTSGLIVLAVVPFSTPVWALAVLMILVGLAGPTVTPPATTLVLNGVPGHQAGTASGVFNTSRQVGGALAIAVFGALLANRATFLQGLRISLLLGAAVALAAAAASLLLRPRRDATAGCLQPDST
jgi:MFS family permease